MSKQPRFWHIAPDAPEPEAPPLLPAAGGKRSVSEGPPAAPPDELPLLAAPPLDDVLLLPAAPDGLLAPPLPAAALEPPAPEPARPVALEPATTGAELPLPAVLAVVGALAELGGNWVLDVGVGTLATVPAAPEGLLPVPASG